MRLRLSVILIILCLFIGGCDNEKRDISLKNTPGKTVNIANSPDITQSPALKTETSNETISPTPTVTPEPKTPTPTVATPTPTPVTTKAPTFTPKQTKTPTPKLTNTPTPKPTNTPTPTPTLTPEPTSGSKILSVDQIVSLLNGESLSNYEDNLHFILKSYVNETLRIDNNVNSSNFSETKEYIIKKVSDTEYEAKVVTTDGSNHETAYFIEGYCYTSRGNIKYQCTFEEFMYKYLLSDVTDLTIKKEHVQKVDYALINELDHYTVHMTRSFITSIYGSDLPQNSSMKLELDFDKDKEVKKIDSIFTASETVKEYGITFRYSVTASQPQEYLPFEDFVRPDLSIYTESTNGSFV